jgi:hypothetical protein
MIIEKFLQFKDKFGNEAFSRLNEFFDIEKGNFYNRLLAKLIFQAPSYPYQN